MRRKNSMELVKTLLLLQVHVHIKRRLMKDLPETDDAIAQWCRDIFVAKVCVLLN